MLCCSLTYLAKDWGEQPVSLCGGGAGAISCLEDICRAEGAGLYPEDELWELAREATEGQEPDVGIRGCGGWTRATEEEEDELGDDGPAAGRDLGYSSGRGPLLKPRLTLYDPIPGELAARREVALLEKTKEEVRPMLWVVATLRIIDGPWQVGRIKIGGGLAVQDHQAADRLRRYLRRRRVRANRQDAMDHRQRTEDGDFVWPNGQVGGDKM